MRDRRGILSIVATFFFGSLFTHQFPLSCLLSVLCAFFLSPLLFVFMPLRARLFLSAGVVLLLFRPLVGHLLPFQSITARTPSCLSFRQSGRLLGLQFPSGV